MEVEEILHSDRSLRSPHAGVKIALVRHFRNDQMIREKKINDLQASPTVSTPLRIIITIRTMR